MRFDIIFENEVGTEPEDEIGSATMHIWYDWDDSKQTYKDSNRIGVSPLLPRIIMYRTNLTYFKESCLERAGLDYLLMDGRKIPSQI